MPQNDYYSDAAAPAAPKETPDAKEEGPGDSQVGELPLAVFPEKPKVGDVCDFEVVQVNENSAVVKYATSEKGEEPHEEEAPPPAEGGGMNSMYE